MISLPAIALIGILIIIGINIAIRGLILFWLSRIFKCKLTDIKTAYKTSALIGFVSFLLILIPLFLSPLWGVAGVNIGIFILNAIISILIIRYFYSISFYKSLLFWAITFGIIFAVGILLPLILTGILEAFGIEIILPIPY